MEGLVYGFPTGELDALRFGIGALSLIPLLMYKKKTDKFEGKGGRKDLLVGEILAARCFFPSQVIGGR